ncbi:MAG: cobalamin-binding protein [Thermoproteota archaeon]|nr:MAG: cobalamin-binding protein [Candidatus Korarchaeota archaeon]
MDLEKTIKEAVLSFDPDKLEEAVKKSLESGYGALEIINALTSALKVVGNMFERGEIFLVQLILAGESSKNVTSKYLEPLIKKEGGKREALGRVVIGTVAGDIHEIGKNIVASMLTSAGFEVIDLGTDVPVEKFVDAVRKYKPDILCLSALLTTTMHVQKEVIEALKRAGLREKVKVVVGGSPVTLSWAEEIGADGYAEDAVEAVRLAKKLVGVE